LVEFASVPPEDHEKWAIESDKYAGRYLTGRLRCARSWNYGAGYSTTGNMVSLVHLDCSSTRVKRCCPGCKAFITQTMALAEASSKQYNTRCMKLAGPELSDYLEYITGRDSVPNNDTINVGFSNKLSVPNHRASSVLSAGRLENPVVSPSVAV